MIMSYAEGELEERLYQYDAAKEAKNALESLK